MKQLNRIIIVIALFTLLTMPAMAQGEMIPPPDTSQDTITLAILAVVAILVVVFGAAIVYAIKKVAESIPPSLRPLFTETVSTGYKQTHDMAEAYANKTPTEIDNKLLDFIDEQIRKRVAEAIPNTDVSVDSTTLTDDIYNP